MTKPNSDDFFGAAPETTSATPATPARPYEWEYSYIPRRTGTQKASTLVFSPLAALKLRYWLHLGKTEVGGFGISRPEDPLYILDIHTLPQRCTSITTEFDDVALAQYLDEKERATGVPGMPPIWIHTHPDMSPNPSGTDEQTFKKHFSQMPFAVMFIMATNHNTYARLQVNSGNGFVSVSKEIPVEEAWGQLPDTYNCSIDDLLREWHDDYDRQVTEERLFPTYTKGKKRGKNSRLDDYDDYEGYRDYTGYPPAYSSAWDTEGVSTGTRSDVLGELSYYGYPETNSDDAPFVVWSNTQNRYVSVAELQAEGEDVFTESGWQSSKDESDGADFSDILDGPNRLEQEWLERFGG